MYDNLAKWEVEYIDNNGYAVFKRDAFGSKYYVKVRDGGSCGVKLFSSEDDAQKVASINNKAKTINRYFLDDLREGMQVKSLLTGSIGKIISISTRDDSLVIDWGTGIPRSWLYHSTGECIEYIG